MNHLHGLAAYAPSREVKRLVNLAMEEIAGDFIVELERASESKKAGVRKKGIVLARGLREKAIDLAMNKATEFSPDIEKLFLTAAKIAYLALGKDHEDLKMYERDVYYYQNSSPPSWIVEVYDDFKAKQLKGSS